MKRNPIVSNLVVVLCVLGIVTAAVAQAPPAEPKSAPAPADVEKQAQDLATHERIVREGEYQEALLKYNEGKALLAQGKQQAAISAFEQALKKLPPGAKAEQLGRDIRASIADVYAAMADALGNEQVYKPRANQNWDEPIALAKKALEYNPDDKHIRDLLADLEHAKANPPPPRLKRGPRPDQTPERIEQRMNLSEKIRLARILMEDNRLDEAEQVLTEVLVEDRNNIPAYHYLRELNDRRRLVDDARRKVAQTKYIEEVERKWLPKIEKPKGPPVAPTGTIAAAKPTEAILKRLNSIIIEEVNFRDTDITAVLNFLTDESRRRDPEGIGVSFVIVGQPSERQIKSLRLRNIKLIEVLKVVMDLVGMRYVVEPSAVVVVPKDSTYGEQLETRTYPIDPALMLRVIPQGMAPPGVLPEPGAGPAGVVPGGGGGGGITVEPAALVEMFRGMGVPFPPGANARYIPQLSRLIVTNTPANLEVLEKLLADLNIGQNQVEIETKFLEVSESQLRELGFDWYLGEWAISRVTRGDRPVNQLLVNPNNATWPPSATPALRRETAFLPDGTPVVLGTGYQTIPNGPTVITGAGSVQVGGNPFVAGQQTNAFTGGLRDLSVVSVSAIDALLGGAGAVISDQFLSIGGVLTHPQFQVVVKALSRSGRSDLLSAPRVTTILGQPATIKIVTEFIYPTRFREPQAVAAAGGVSGSAGVAVTPSTPIAFATREVGVLLTVTPTLGADGYTINLSLNPEVSEFLGFINYGGKIQIPATGAPQGYVEVDNRITQPIFATRSVLTNVVIWDGQTVVLGGLAREDITEINDKIPLFGDLPFVGRLFRSKGKSIGKRHLIIFVTATLIDPAGNRVHPEGSTTAMYLPGPTAPGGVAPAPAPGR